MGPRLPVVHPPDEMKMRQQVKYLIIIIISTKSRGLVSKQMELQLSKKYASS